MKAPKSTSSSDKLLKGVQLARLQLTRAEHQRKTAKEQARKAKRRRKEARDNARRAKQQAKLAKRAVAEAKKVLGEAEKKLARAVKRKAEAAPGKKARKTSTSPAAKSIKSIRPQPDLEFPSPGNPPPGQMGESVEPVASASPEAASGPMPVGGETVG